MTSIRDKNSRESSGRADLSFVNCNLSAALHRVVAGYGMGYINRDGRAVNSNCIDGTHGI